MKQAVVIVLLAIAPFAFAATPNNDDSCDISALPAATLLLPYFEVDLTNVPGENTLFTITNVTQRPQIARVTLWTDRAFPALSFNIFLTGYDVQSISLRDVIVLGAIAPPDGTSSHAEEGTRSLDNDENPFLDVSNCGRLITNLTPWIREDLVHALSIGRVPGCGTARVGDEHAASARGFVTIDVVRNCGGWIPSDAAYFTEDLLYDNVLIGDYQQVDRANNFAQGGTMVHLRAIPEGGWSGSVQPSFARTFYSRLQNGATTDRRQPLPSSFSSRWITGSSGTLQTSFKIWREAMSPANTACDVAARGANRIDEIVRFDEDENWVGMASPLWNSYIPEPVIRFPAASRLRAADTTLFPPNPGADIAGWMYMNLDDEIVESPIEHASQSWVIVSMAAEGRFSLDNDAIALGNGCSSAAPVTAEDGTEPAIRPAANDNAAASGLTATTDNDDSCDIAALPAATLLLPYFEVDLLAAQGDTLFSVTNVSPLPQIARVTIWTDRSYPVLNFNIFLTGYDVQSISLHDVIANGVLAPPNGTSSETTPGARSAPNTANPLLDLANCNRPPVALPPSIAADVRGALTRGRISSCGTAQVGNNQPDGRARGFITIDLVANCGTKTANDPSYFAGDLLFDNVLTGDYQQVDRANNFAQGGLMVHIRAIPEGGAPGAQTTSLPRTFYSRHQKGGKADRRQPLPSTFAAHWITGGTGAFNASFKIWREATTTPDAGCLLTSNAEIHEPEFVRFDEDENPTSFTPDIIGPPLPPYAPRIPSSSNLAAADTTFFPPNPGGDIAGWIYLNLDDRRDAVANQNWVVVSLRAEGRFSADFDAPALGNGCSSPAPLTSENGGPPAIGPAPNGGRP